MINEPHTPSNSPPAHPHDAEAPLPILPPTQSVQLVYPRSDVTATPEKLKKWWSSQVFKTVTYFILMLIVLCSTTAAFFVDKMSQDAWVGSISTILMLGAPSPLLDRGKKTTKKFYGGNASSTS